MPTREILYWLEQGQVKQLTFRHRFETESWILLNMATSVVNPDCRFYLLNNLNEWWESLPTTGASQTRRDKYYLCRNIDWVPKQIRMARLIGGDAGI